VSSGVLAGQQRTGPRRARANASGTRREPHRIASAASTEGSEGKQVTETAKAGGVRSRVLVVDDDAALAEMLSIVLRNEGFDPVWCAHGDKALGAFKDAKPDLVLLDLMLPGRDGVDVCRDIRAESGVPIVMLTAKTDTIDVVEGLEAGADDYVAKPFKAKELVARIKTRLRRTPSADETDAETLRIGDLAISVDGHSVKRDGNPIQLTPLEFDLLLALARRPWQVFSREVLLEQVWGYRHAADTRLVNVHVQRLRSKIERDPEHPEIVVTVRGIGYKAGEPQPV
jgi:two-component system, OmpR family, response regulator MtrA